MKAKKLFPDLSFKRLWDKIKELENKVGDGSDSEQNKNMVEKIPYPNWNGTVEEIVSLVSSKSHTYTTNEDCIIYCEAQASGANGQGYNIKIGNILMKMQAPQGGVVSSWYPVKKDTTITFSTTSSVNYARMKKVSFIA